MGLFNWKQTKKEDRGKKRADAVSVKVSDDKSTKKIAVDKKSSADKSVKKAVVDKKIAVDKKAVVDKKTSAGKSMKELYGKSEVTTTTKEGKKVKKERKYGNAYRVLVKPLITEKAANLGTENKYVFAVSVRANKIEVAKAVDELYGVKPVSVNIIKMQGKKVRQGRTKGKRKDWKKAIVTLPEGKTINIYEGV